MTQFFEFLGKVAALVATLGGGWWAFVSWRKRNELFPRVYFEVRANFLKTEYNYVTAIAADAAYIRVQADFEYMEHGGQSHHAARILKVPESALVNPAELRFTRRG